MTAISSRFSRCFLVLGLSASALFLALPARGQSASGAGTPGTQTQQPLQPGQTAPAAQEEEKHHSIFSRSTGSTQPGQLYQRPSERVKLHNYLFDAFGPYPFIGAAGAAGIAQARGVPPEWGQGWDAYGVRTASYYGVTLISTTTRYGLAEAFREDTLYYRCDCHGVFPRLGHALISTVTARRGDDGHRTFSFPSLAAPYAGSMIGVAAWYPRRFEPMDGFRIGNYNLLYQGITNVALEFIYGGPHTLLSHLPGSSLTGSQPESSSKKH
ncbi:MAG TPA: hypothetical protein VL913_00955 [Candidatus Micrarchaeaceae archaeon]|nr:hypothetical protein [Candidatus Micrarchaeaceae archaeon]